MTQPTASVQFEGLKSWSIGRAVAVTLAVSAAVFGFLVWLIYFKAASAHSSPLVGYLDGVNALLNSLSTAFLVAGFLAIKRGDWRRHQRYMLAALGSSALFFVSYVVYHNFHTATTFTSEGPVRPVYYFILFTHIVLSAVSVPLILLSFFTSLAGRLAVHRKISKFTFPIWLYVSVTGVLVYLLLKAFNA